MHLLDLTLPTLPENLALDEALLDELDASEGAPETLRLWSPSELAVVVGRSSRLVEEVRCDACRAGAIPIVRRGSGGAAIVTGPGCLMYALTLDLRRRPQLRRIESAHRFVLETLAAALAGTADAPGSDGRSGSAARLEVARRGISDLAIGPRKCSGNSLHVKRDGLLYHGTLLYDFPLDRIEQLLTMPPRWPEYRRGRPHADFVGNLPWDEASLRRRVVAAWNASTARTDWPVARTAQWVAQRYGRPEWHQAR
jgi:lipoate-protein ligase A